jgi:hypothetical protein
MADSDNIIIQEVVENIVIREEVAEIIEIETNIGVKGDPGEPGTPGVSGLSAYEIWLALGNTGTEQDFIDSLGGTGDGVADVPYDTYNMSSKVGAKVQVGSGPGYITGEVDSIIYSTRVGRTVSGVIAIALGAGAVWAEGDPFFPINLITIYGRDMPYLPRMYPPMSLLGIPPAGVGNFAIINITDLETETAEGFAIGSVFTDFGGALQDPGMVFFHATKPTVADITNLVFEGNQADLIGNLVIIYGRFTYEAKYELGHFEIVGDLTADGMEGSVYSSSVTLEISQGSQLPATVEISDGTLPAGLSIGISDVKITVSGTPEEEGEYTFTIKATGDNEAEVEKEFTITVSPYVPPSGIEITDSFSNGMEDFAYSSTAIVDLESDGEQLPISQALQSGTLPTGLSLSIENDTQLVLSGTPTVPNYYTFTVRITDTNGATYDKEFNVNIEPYNPEVEPLYLGTVSGNSYNIQFATQEQADAYGGWSVNIHDFTTAYAQEGMILKIRSGTMNWDFGEGVISVAIGDYMIYEGGYWREYNYA